MDILVLDKGDLEKAPKVKLPKLETQPAANLALEGAKLGDEDDGRSGRDADSDGRINDGTKEETSAPTKAGQEALESVGESALSGADVADQLANTDTVDMAGGAVGDVAGSMAAKQGIKIATRRAAHRGVAEAIRHLGRMGGVYGAIAGELGASTIGILSTEGYKAYRDAGYDEKAALGMTVTEARNMARRLKDPKAEDFKIDRNIGAGERIGELVGGIGGSVAGLAAGGVGSFLGGAAGAVVGAEAGAIFDTPSYDVYDRKTGVKIQGRDKRRLLRQLGFTKASGIDLQKLEASGYVLQKSEAFFRKTDLTDIDAAAAKTEEPTERQKQTGVYKKGKVRLNGLTISIETPRGAMRSGEGWEVMMPAHYGYIQRTEGADGDHVDVYLGQEPDSPFVWVVDQHDPRDGGFDEHKCFLAFPDRETVRQTYDAAFSDGSGPERRRAIRRYSLPAFRNWLRGDTTVPVAKADISRELRKVSRSVETSVAVGLSRAMQWLEDTVVGIVSDSVDVTDPVPDAQVQEVMSTAMEPLRSKFWQAARKAVNDNTRVLDGDKRIGFAFDIGFGPTVQRVENYQMNLIRGITDEQERMVRAVVSRGIAEGVPPAETARSLRDIVGLTPRQAESVVRYREELKQGNSNSLRRALRDRRFDRTVARAIRDGENLTDAQVDKMVEAYKRRYVAYRSMTVARTESLRAANIGSKAAIEQAISRGVITPDQVTKTWLATRDSRTRDTHRDLNGKSVQGLDTPFMTSAGNQIRHPLDPEAPAEETINCRCTLKWTVRPSSMTVSEPESDT